MTTPKSPEQIMEELREITQPYCASGCGCFEDGIPGHEGSCVTKCSTFEEQKAWLRSSMASLLLWAAENCSMSKEQREAEDLLFSAVKDGMDDILSMSRQAHARGYHTGQERCRAFLIEEARKILEK